MEAFEWNVPDELLQQYDPDDSDSLQQLIDEYFDPNDINVATATNTYYELFSVEDES